MQFGIFAKTFHRPDATATLRAVADAGYRTTQFNLSVVGLPTVPSSVPRTTVDEVRAAVEVSGVGLAAISGTFNAAHPDPAHRAEYLRRFPVLCRFAADLSIPVITLSSGSRDAEDMWRWHDDNTTEDAWDDSRAVLTQLARIASDAGVAVAVEPEFSNIVTTAALGARMLDQVASDALGVVFDAANLLDPETFELETASAQIRSDVELLAPHLLLVHAKELRTRRSPGPAGKGLVPWPIVLESLESVDYRGSVIVHGLSESDAVFALETLRRAQPQRA